MTRTLISKTDIISGNFDKDKQYYYGRGMNISKINLTTFDKITGLPIRHIFRYFDIDILIQDELDFCGLPDLEFISEKTIVESKCIGISKCPLLKTLPLKLTNGLHLKFNHEQHLITILSEEQFNVLKSLTIYWNFGQASGKKEICSYEEYYSLIEPTIIKNNLSKVCTF